MKFSIHPQIVKEVYTGEKCCQSLPKILDTGYSKKPLYNFPGDIARIEFGPAGDVIDKFVLKKERFEKPYSLE